MDDTSQGDICRVCRCEGSADRPLFYPCICTGSIKYIHQECLMQWMRYSHKEFCELCGHRFGFQPIYSPDMPRVLPLKDVLVGLFAAIFKGIKSWLHYSLVITAWFGIVPLTAYRTYRFLFQATTLDMILSLPYDIFSLSNITNDIIYGFFVVLCTLLSFIGLVWLREQILRGGGPDWLEREERPAVAVAREVVVEEEANANDPNNEQGGDDSSDQEEVNDGANENLNEELRVEEENGPAVPVLVDIAPRDVPMDNAAPAVADPAENEGDVPLDQAQAADNDENNWNPMEWDRAAEELTWDRLLGLDGSLVFLEHVFWIISLNTLFIISFAFCPYSVGNFVLDVFKFLKKATTPPMQGMHGLITTLVGYCFIGLTLLVLHFCAQIFRLSRLRWFIGICYIVVKVALLCVTEVLVLPLVCGWWLDICSLPLFDGTMKERRASFAASPGTSLFMHWLFGMIYVYYFAAFVSILREVLRPGVLWILRNVNDPDFSPIQEMIHVPIMLHIRRLIGSAMIFGCAVLLTLWVPIRLLQLYWTNFLPYTLSGDSEVNDMSLQVILLQVVLPSFFEQTQTRIWLKAFLRCWCNIVSKLLGIRSYLLGDAENNEYDNQQNEPENEDEQEDHNAQQQIPEGERQPLLGVNNARNHIEQNLDAFHRVIRHNDAQSKFNLYVRPSLFPLRILVLLFLMCISLVVSALLIITVPISIGRGILRYWTNVSAATLNKPITRNGSTVTIVTAVPENMARPHELYTAEIGISLCWIIARIMAMAVSLLPQGRQAIINKLKQWINIALRYSLPILIIVLLLGVVPLMFGTLMELSISIPLRVRLRDTPLHSLWQYWFLGVFYTKLAIGSILMGPDWFLRRNLERAYHDGLRDIDVHFLIRDLARPVIMAFGLSLAVPYVFAHSFVLPFIKDPWTAHAVLRLCHLTAALVAASVVIFLNQIRQFKRLYTSIKADKYLVGQRLVNYEHHKRQQESENKQTADAAITQTEDVQPALPEHEQNVENAKREENVEQSVLARQRLEVMNHVIVDQRDKL